MKDDTDWAAIEAAVSEGPDAEDDLVAQVMAGATPKKAEKAQASRVDLPTPVQALKERGERAPMADLLRRIARSPELPHMVEKLADLVEEKTHVA